MAAVASTRVGFVQGLLLGLIHVYRFSLGFLIGGRCRFHPSCSTYGLEAIRRHGAVRGMVLLVARLLRCHPWHPGGLDPVPYGESEP